MPPPYPRIALLACAVFEREVALHGAGASHIAETRFFEVGLHDRPDKLRETLQAELDGLDAREDIDAVVMAYGLCGCGTSGLRAKRHRFVIPRAHDCITVFMGSKEKYAEQQRACPTCYYYTPGWNRERRVPGPERLESLRADLSKQFDEDNVDFLIETEQEAWAAHDKVLYVDLGTDEAEKEAEYSSNCAKWLGWKFERMHGDPTLLRDLLWGNWDAERFQIIEPGSKLGNSGDEAVMRAESAEGKASA
jgi:hypothetical protein